MRKRNTLDFGRHPLIFPVQQRLERTSNKLAATPQRRRVL
jgi:hypothetical protein